LIENPAKFDSKLFHGSKLAAMFAGAPRVILPELSPHTVETIQKKGVELRKSLTFAEAIGVLPIAARMETQHWMSRVFIQFNAVKNLLTADPAAVKNDFKAGEVRPTVPDLEFFDL